MLKSYLKKGKIEVGCDEAGRGCLAGPVVAAAVIINQTYKPPIPLNDSKKLNLKQRVTLEQWIRYNLDYGIGVVSHEEIDQINILNASFLAMHRAIDQLKQNFDLLLIDGNRFNPYKGVEHHCIIKGDAKFKSIAAASILAKTHRDHIMDALDKEFPDYGWNKNKGYPTRFHRNAIIEHGISTYHRKSYQLLPKQLKLKI